MSGSTSSERMNNLFQEMKLHYLTEPEPGVNLDHDLTLSWPLRNSQVSLVFGSAILLKLNEPGKDTASLDLTGFTDAEIIDLIIRWGLIESKRTLTA